MSSGNRYLVCFRGPVLTALAMKGPSVESTADFTEGGLIRMLLDLRNAGYEFGAFTNAEVPPQGQVILRHDVDLDLVAAQRIAQIECDLGVSATFFFLVSSNLYNVMSVEGRTTCKQILSLGHHIGLHFDPTVFGSTEEEFDTGLSSERRLLEEVTGLPISVFSLHKPGNRSQLYPVGPEGLLNTYSRRFFSDIAYSSDSSGWWRFGSFIESDDFRSHRSVQLLLHPIWWTGLLGEHPGKRLDRLVDDLRVKGQSQIASTIDPYGLYLAERKDELGGWPTDLGYLRSLSPIRPEKDRSEWE